MSENAAETVNIHYRKDSFKWADINRIFNSGSKPLMKYTHDKYGSFELEVLSDFVSINHKHKLDDTTIVDYNALEEVTLIAENHSHIHSSFIYPLNGKGYFILYNSKNTAALCRIKILEFKCSRSAQAEIDAMARYRSWMPQPPL